MKKEAQVLDVGCGDGYGTYKLSRAGYKAVGVDLSEVMIQKGKERGEGEFIFYKRRSFCITI